jgi:uncharacterized protein
MRTALLLGAALLAGACDSRVEANAQGISAGNGNVAGADTVAHRGFVIDNANILPAAREQALAEALGAVERDAGPRFAIVTLPSLHGRPIEDVAVDLGRRWGIGDGRRRDGVLLIVAPNERNVRIEVGYGLEASLRDERCAEIIARDILPRFREGDLVGGIEAGADAIIARLRASPTRHAA